jgi:transcriptional regulator with XRE-family HTH domain
VNAQESRAYALALGANLRRIRKELGLSLTRVEEKSNGHWKQVVVGSYERGDRNITVPRLAALAEFYGVPVADLLPETAPVAVVPTEEALRLARRITALLGGLYDGYEVGGWQ